MSGYFVHGGTQYPFGQGQQHNRGSGSGNTSGQLPYFSGGGGGGNKFSSQSQNSQDGYNQPSSQYSSFSNTSTYGLSSGYSSQYPYGSGSDGGYGNAPSNNRSMQDVNYTSDYNETSINSSANYSSGTPYGGVSSGKAPGFGSYNKSSYGNTNSGSFGSYSGEVNHTSYEKALLNAANQYYGNRNRGGSVRGSRGSFLRGRGGRGASMSAAVGSGGKPAYGQSSGPKLIKATEIKAYLYAWCGQRKLKPEYEITPKGMAPNAIFACRLHINGLKYVAQVEAPNKRDSQSKAAWDFCENLVKMGYMKATELPPKPAEPVPKSISSDQSESIGSIPAETVDDVEKYGGWTLTNCRQRLNQFCQREHTTPDFKHQTLGPEHARVFICDLQLNVKSVQKEFAAKERGSNKKQATAVCALSMIRQLYSAGLIEKFGDPIKHVSRGSLLVSKTSGIALTPKPKEDDESSMETAVVGQKRKADDKASQAIDDNGNWTVDNSRQRLNQFCQTHNIPCDVIYAEEGAPGNKTYTASLNLKVNSPEAAEQELQASSTATTKKAAAQGCALQLLSQLFKLTLVEANAVPGPTSSKKPTKVKPLMEGSPYPNYGFPSYGMMSGFPASAMFGQAPMLRRTPVHDMYLNEKHKSIYPTDRELDGVQHTVRMIELALKEVSDEISDANKDASTVVKTEQGLAENSETSGKRKVHGVMRIGALAKGLLLKGDTNVKIVLLCHEAPTAKLLVQIAQLLPKHIKGNDTDKVSVETAMPEASIMVYNTMSKSNEQDNMTVSVAIHLTSPVVRTPKEDAQKDPPGSLNKDKCLQALADLRHAKWFQACANGIPSCVVVIRIVLEMKKRLPEWSALSDWAVELMVEKALKTSPVPLTLGSSFLRFLECIASGILEPERGISDPCERTDVDVTANMTNQERETVTKAAQDALRLFVFRQLHKVLGMDEIKKPEWMPKKLESSKSATQ